MKVMRLSNNTKINNYPSNPIQADYTFSSHHITLIFMMIGLTKGRAHVNMEGDNVASTKHAVMTLT